jgi:hypothetical protein
LFKYIYFIGQGLTFKQSFFYTVKKNLIKMVVFQMDNILIVSFKNAKTNAFSSLFSNILGAYLVANLNINSNIEQNYLV